MNSFSDIQFENKERTGYISLKEATVNKKIEIVTHGISKSQLLRLKDTFNLNYDDLSILLGVTNRYVHIKKGTDTINRQASDRVMALAEIFIVGYEIFENEELFHEWLHLPCCDLDYLMPFSMLHTLVGIQAVKTQLSRLKVSA